MCRFGVMKKGGRFRKKCCKCREQENWVQYVFEEKTKQCLNIKILVFTLTLNILSDAVVLLQLLPKPNRKKDYLVNLVQDTALFPSLFTTRKTKRFLPLSSIVDVVLAHPAFVLGSRPPSCLINFKPRKEGELAILPV